MRCTQRWHGEQQSANRKINRRSNTRMDSYTPQNRQDVASCIFNKLQLCARIARKVGVSRKCVQVVHEWQMMVTLAKSWGTIGIIGQRCFKRKRETKTWLVHKKDWCILLDSLLFCFFNTWIKRPIKRSETNEQKLRAQAYSTAASASRAARFQCAYIIACEYVGRNDADTDTD